MSNGQKVDQHQRRIGYELKYGLKLHERICGRLRGRTSDVLIERIDEIGAITVPASDYFLTNTILFQRVRVERNDLADGWHERTGGHVESWSFMRQLIGLVTFVALRSWSNWMLKNYPLFFHHHLLPSCFLLIYGSLDKWSPLESQQINTDFEVKMKLILVAGVDNVSCNILIEQPSEPPRLKYRWASYTYLEEKGPLSSCSKRWPKRSRWWLHDRSFA